MEITDRHICIFCPNALDDSREHIIPDCLNGRLASRELICSVCNARFGMHLDDDIKIQMNPILLFMGFKNAQQFYVYSHDNRQYLMKKDRTMEPIRPELHVVKKKGKNHFRLTGEKRDVNNVLKKMNELLQTKIKGAKFVANETKSEIGVIPGTHAPLKLTITGKTILLFNKIALEFFALKKGDMNEVTGLLKHVHGLETSLQNVTFCNKNNEIRDFESSEESHFIFLNADSKTKTIRVYIELFNVFCGMVNLSDSYTGEDITAYYHQDAITGKRIDTEPKLKKPLTEVVSSVITNDDLSTLCFMQAERHRERYLMEAVDMNAKAILEDLKDAAAKKIIEESEIARLYLQASANMIAQLAFVIPYSIEMEEGMPPYEDDRYNFYHSNFKPEKLGDFLDKQQHLLKVKMVIDGELFYFRSFFRESYRPVTDITLITLYVAAESAETKKLHYIPIRKVFELLNRARPLEEHEIKEYESE